MLCSLVTVPGVEHYDHTNLETRTYTYYGFYLSWCNSVSGSKLPLD